MMMSYEQFKYSVKKEIRKYLPEEMKDCEISYRKTWKINEEKEAINFRGPLISPRVSPTIYLDDMYKKYLEYREFDAVMIRTFYSFEEFVKEGNRLSHMMDLKNPKGNIICQLINTEQNQEMLRDMPHRQLVDLSIIYRYVIEKDEECGRIITAPINYGLAKMLDLKEEELYQEAMKAMKETVSTSIKPMVDVIEEMTGVRLAEEAMEDVPHLYVITNSVRTFGAANILDAEKMQQLAEEVEGDLYLIPSSVEEVIAVKAGELDIRMLLDVIYDINLTQVDAEDRLSNNLYYYDKDKDEISLVAWSAEQELAA